MVVMGDLSEADWAAELEANGQVVFRQRRRLAVFRLLIVVLPQVWMLPLGVDIWRDDAGLAFDVFRSVSLVVALAVIGYGCWLLVSQPVLLTVDRNGIRTRGRKALRWSEIGTIGFPTGPPGFRTLPVIPANKSRRRYADQDAVKDLTAFADWLGVLLEEHRQASSNR
jgi:hypothetical protein